MTAMFDLALRRGRNRRDHRAGGYPAPDVVVLGRYRLVDKVGDTAGTSLWRGQDDRLRRPVSVRFVPARRPKASELRRAGAARLARDRPSRGPRARRRGRHRDAVPRRRDRVAHRDVVRRAPHGPPRRADALARRGRARARGRADPRGGGRGGRHARQPATRARDGHRHRRRARPRPRGRAGAARRGARRRPGDRRHPRRRRDPLRRAHRSLARCERRRRAPRSAGAAGRGHAVARPGGRRRAARPRRDRGTRPADDRAAPPDHPLLLAPRGGDRARHGAVALALDAHDCDDHDATSDDLPPPRRTGIRVGSVVVGAACAVGIAYLGMQMVLGLGGSPLTVPRAALQPSQVATSASALPTASAGDKVIPIVSVSDYDPFGNNKQENPQLAPLAVDDNPASAWTTVHYKAADMSGRAASGCSSTSGRRGRSRRSFSAWSATAPTSRCSPPTTPRRRSAPSPRWPRSREPATR